MVETSFLFFSILVPSFLFIILIKLLKSSILSRNAPPLPPGPYPWPVLGNILQLGKKPHVTLTNFAQSYGPLISLKLGTQTMIVGSSPAAAAEILKTHDRVLSARYVPHVLPAGNSEKNSISMGWALECDENWKNLRTICRSGLLSGKAIESQACLRERKIGEMVKFVKGMEGKMVMLRDLVFATVFNMLSNLILSRDFISLEDEGESAGEEGMKGLIRKIFAVASAPNLSDFYPILGPLDLQGLKKISNDLFVKLCAMWEPIVKERRRRRKDASSSSSEQKDFLDFLLDNSLTNEQIKHLFMELFGAGTDTGTSTVEWAMAELIKNPDSMKKLRAELAREISQSSIKESQLSHLPYLQSCVKETLRLHPPAPLLLPHRASSSCEVMNYTIPKNAQVAVNVWAISRDAMVWEEPSMFKPERFVDSNLDFKGKDFEFLPFGAGRRICPGLPMAARSVPLILASLVYFFDWSLPDGTDPKELNMDEKFGITLQKDQPLFLIPKSK